MPSSQSSGAENSTRKDYFNCVGVPIVCNSFGQETFVIDKFAIPTLHCILGPCNRLYHYLEENCPGFEMVSKKLGIVRDPYNNKDYNGNYCEKIMKNIDLIEKAVEIQFKPFTECLKALKEVKDSCFGPFLRPNYKRAIEQFEQAWFDLYIEFEIPFSNKCHVIIEHVPQVIERTGTSLYLSSEQVVEATHAKFEKSWQKYKVLDPESESHGQQLYNCVLDFNSKNL